ncbi:hypothetical protein AOC36_01555 [Erysipelothrix larvae]|uniref:Sugar ABC transporter substrate-binding protein n=1 Tax=Erysipelothrix larvae TaxID=1514105 RepID=A0A109UGJ6_9FIRM|nr:extracellular solute-binding protein [Erysipelothrix larvae]AMC92718.1 hypothetical protein AOC36_01555 [Erysipelothrix larvae]
MFKKGFRLLAITLATFALVACGSTSSGDDKGPVTLKLWGSQDDQAFLKERVEAFKAANPDTDYTIELGVVGEPDAREQVLADLDAAADVFAFPNDQLRTLVDAGALYQITLNKDAIIAANGQGSVEASMLDDKLFAYPFSADNGYFMYYNSEIFSEEDVKSLDAMVARADAEGKRIYFDLSNGWYIASFFLGAGGELSLADGKQIVDWNNEAGLAVGEAIRTFANSQAHITGDDAALLAGLEDGSIIAAVSGTWMADDFENAFGEGYAATKLPTFTKAGEQVQLGSFGGYKLYGVKTSTEFPEEAMKLAEFLSNEESQIIRFEERATGPSNLKAAASEAVQANVALSALAAQAPYSSSQMDVIDTFWGPAEAFGTEIENGSTRPMQELLDEMVAQITK